MFTRKNRNGIQEMSQLSGHHPIRRKPPREAHFSANSSKGFSLQKKFYPPAGLFQITIFRRCDPRTRTWSDSASEDYASSSFPFERASELPATFHSQVISRRSFNRVPWFSKNFPSRGYSNKTKDYQQSQYSYIQMTDGNLFSQIHHTFIFIHHIFIFTFIHSYIIHHTSYIVHHAHIHTHIHTQ